MKKFGFILSACAALTLSAQTQAPQQHAEGRGVALLTLDSCKRLALQNNIAIRQAKHNISAAGQQRKETFTKYFPTVSATGVWFNANKGMAKMDINPSEIISPELGASLAQLFPPQMLASMSEPMSMTMMKRGTIASLTAVQPVFAGGQIVNGNKLAKVGEDVSKLQLQLSENEVEKTVEGYFWQLASLQEKMKTVQAVEALLSDIHKDVDVAVKAGVAMRNDLLQVQLRQNDTESQKLTLQNNIGLLKSLLGQYMGLRPVAGADGASAYLFDVAVPDAAEPVPVLPTRVGEEQAVASLPEYQLLDKQVEAARLQRKMAVGKNLPSLAVGAGYNYHNLLENDRSFGMVFATVSIPISDWWGGSHAIRRKKIEQMNAQEQQANQTEMLKIRMQQTWNNVGESYQQLLIAQRSIDQAAENLRLNRDYYRAGTSRMSDLLEAQLLYQQALDRRVDAVADYHNKLLAYRQAVGER